MGGAQVGYIIYVPAAATQLWLAEQVLLDLGYLVLSVHAVPLPVVGRKWHGLEMV